MNVGRPTDYSEQMLAQAREYVELCEDQEVVRAGRGDELVYKIRAKLPTTGGLARYLGVARSTLYEWAKSHPEFSDVMENLGAEQEDRLINAGLTGDYNSTITKVLLTKHGYREGIEQTGLNGAALIPEKTDKDAADAAIASFINGHTGNTPEQRSKED